MQSNAAASVIFKQNNGIEYLQDAEYLSEVENFDYYYKRLKKVNLLSRLNSQGIDTSEFYMEDLTYEPLDLGRTHYNRNIYNYIDLGSGFRNSR